MIVLSDQLGAGLHQLVQHKQRIDSIRQVEEWEGPLQFNQQAMQE